MRYWNTTSPQALLAKTYWIRIPSEMDVCNDSDYSLKGGLDLLFSYYDRNMSIALQAKQPNFLDFLINLLHRYLKVHTLTINAKFCYRKIAYFMTRFNTVT